ncbi:MAG: hypothetical protein Q9191_007043 [Dirinaria sp. TL-2023a]
MAAPANAPGNTLNDILQEYETAICNAVTIEIGPAKILYRLPKDVLCNISPYFRTALNGNTKEAAEQSIWLPHVDVDVFDSFVCWLDGGDIDRIDEDSAWTYLIELYVFADSHELYYLMNDITDAMIEIVCAANPKPTEFDLSVLHSIYNYSTPGSRLRKFFVDLAIYKPDMIKLRHDLSQHYPDEYLADLCQEQSTFLQAPVQIPTNPNPTRLEMAIAQRPLVPPQRLWTLDFKARYHIPQNVRRPLYQIMSSQSSTEEYQAIKATPDTTRKPPYGKAGARLRLRRLPCSTAITFRRYGSDMKLVPS